MSAVLNRIEAARLGPWLLVGLVALLCIVALGIGQFPIGPVHIIEVLSSRLLGWPSEVPDAIVTVILQVRLPRIAAALVVGAALAAAGAAYQGLFRNPLVSPDILGVSAGAGLGAVFGIFLSLPVIGIQLLAFVFGIATVSLVYLVASAVRGREPVLVLVLAGVVLGTLAGSMISLLKVLADPYDQLPAITFWLLGSLAAVKLEDLATTLPITVLGLIPLVLLRWRINVLSLGDEEAKALGIEAGGLRMVVVAAATLMTASVVSIAGIIGWVGLIMPHMARMVVGPNFDRLLPAAMILGAGYLLIVDTLARSIAAVETPLGILTAFVGAPVFLWLLARGRHGWS